MISFVQELKPVKFVKVSMRVLANLSRPVMRVLIANQVVKLQFQVLEKLVCLRILLSKKVEVSLAFH